MMCLLQAQSQVCGEPAKMSFQSFFLLAALKAQTFQLHDLSGRKNSNLQSAAIDSLSAVCH